MGSLKWSHSTLHFDIFELIFVFWATELFIDIDWTDSTKENNTQRLQSSSCQGEIPGEADGWPNNPNVYICCLDVCMYAVVLCFTGKLLWLLSFASFVKLPVHPSLLRSTCICQRRFYVKTRCIIFVIKNLNIWLI